MLRITTSMLASNYLTNMNRNLRNMKTIQSQLSSGKEISRPSDNPYKVSRIMQLYSEIDANTQFNENIKDVSNWLDTTDTALGQAGNLFARVRELIISAGNASYGDDEKKAIQDEIKQKVHELSQILNTNFDGAYIFGGTKSTSKPVMVDGNGEIQYANKNGEAINNIYVNIAGDIVNVGVSSNAELQQSDKIYLDSSGKITTSSKAKDGIIDNTQIVSTNTLYVDGTGTVSTLSSGGNQLYLKDDLYVDLNGNCTPSKTTENTLITSDDELFYLTPTGQVTTKYNATYTTIPTGQILYRDSSGKVTPSAAGNTAIDSSTPLYTDQKGFVTTLSVTVNTKLEDVVPAVTSVTGVQLSTYTPGTGYAQTAIASPYDAYMDSRGVLTNSLTTDLSLRSATLKQVWENSYIDSADEQLKGGTATSPNKQIHLYKDLNGEVTTSPGSYPANEQILLGTTLYEDSNGKVTTIAGTGTTPIQLDNTVYVDLNGALTTNSTVTNNVVSLRDNLSITTASMTDNAKAVIGAVPATDSEIPSDTVTLYIDDTTGNISKNSAGKKIILGDSLYLDSNENISVLKETENTLVNSDDKLYGDANGNITNLAVNPLITSATTLYKDSTTGSVTTSSGGTPPNTTIDLQNAVLYKDSKGNVTTVPGSNTQISNTTSLYKDVNGNITTVEQNTAITSDTKLYNDSGNITTKPSGSSLSAGTQLYISGGNITTTVSGSSIATIPIAANTLYMDASGNLTNVSTAPNMPIPSGTELYDDGGIVKTKLIKTGESLYVNSNGKIIKDSTTLNTELTINDKVYVDAAGSLTMSSTSTNTEITMSNIKSFEKEVKSSNNDNAAQLLQICSDLNVEVSQGVLINYNTTAAGILEYKDKTGASNTITNILNDIIKNLNSSTDPTNPGDISKLTGEDLTQIDAIIRNILQKRSEVGAMTNRMESAQAKNEDENLNMKDILSKTEDIDFTEKTMEYSIMQTIYMAALQTGAKVLPKTILDYL